MEHTLPESFENVSMTCKSIYIKSTSLRTRHNDLKTRYQDFSYDLFDDADADGEDDTERVAEQLANQLENCYSSLQLLLRIADDPLIMEYIVTADFKNDRIPNDYRFTEAVAQQAKESKNLLSLLGNSSYFHHAGYDPERLLDHLVTKFGPENGTSGVAATFLLTLLPNVTTLSLPEEWVTYDWGDSKDFWERDPALEDLTIRANDPNDPTAGLSKLTSIIPSVASGYDTRWALEMFNPFLSIRTVTSFIAGGCVAVEDGYTGMPFPNPSDENYGVNIEEVILAGSVVDAEELQKFLERLPKLKHLKISYETKWHGCGHDMDANAIFAAIESTTGDTLESLTFAVHSCYGDVSIVKPPKQFTKLKELELDSQVLMGVNSATTVSPLVDLVPASVERFCLLVERMEDYGPKLNRLFEGFVADIGEKLPNLKEVVIRYLGEELLDLDALEVVAGETPETGLLVTPWKRELVALRKLIDVRTVKLLVDTATFMEGFCEKYGLVPE